MRRWGAVIGLVLGGLALLPFATAGAQAPTTDPAAAVAPEGSVPPGGTVNCTTGATLTPPNGPPGTEVTVTTTFQGNCDDLGPFFLETMTCTGQVTGMSGGEALNFDMTVDGTTGDATGTFVAPPSEPDPPVVDAVEPLAVTVTCTVIANPTSPAEGNQGTTTYQYPPSTFSLELAADTDGEQPTLVDNDQEVADNGVVGGTPTFTG